MRRENIHLTATEARQLVTLLGHLQSEMESAIETELLVDGSVPPSRKVVVKELRRRWKRAEDWVKRLSGNKQ